jgi:hypothetical protein
MKTLDVLLRSTNLILPKRKVKTLPFIVHFQIFKTFVIFLVLFPKLLQSTVLLMIVCIKRFVVIDKKSSGCRN